MSERTRLVPQLADLTSTHTLVIESTHEYKLYGPYGWKVGTIGPIDLEFMSTFNDQSMSIGCIGKFRHWSVFFQTLIYLLNAFR